MLKKLYFISIRVDNKKLEAGDTFCENLGKILANDPYNPVTFSDFQIYGFTVRSANPDHPFLISDQL